MLTINPEKACYIIVKARVFDAKVDPMVSDPGSNPADDQSREILEERPADPNLQELIGAIEALNQDEIMDVVALVWIGRGDYGAAQWDEARAIAGERVDARVAHYLTGIPLLADFLEGGLAELGYPCADFELGRM
jgi:hypothetical protein